MQKSKGSDLGIIKHGAIDFYYALKIETKQSFSRLCKNIDAHISAVFGKYDSELKSAFRRNIEEAKEQLGIGDEIKIVDDGAKKKRSFKRVAEETGSKKNIIRLELASDGGRMKYTPVTDVHDFLRGAREASNNDYRFSRTVYGSAYVDSQMRFVLPPFSIELSDGGSVFAEAFLFVFRNKSAVLRITLPLRCADSAPLYENAYDCYIKSISNPCSLSVVPSENSMGAVMEAYCRFTAGVSGIKAVVFCGEVNNIVLADYSGSPEDIKRLSPGFMEELYKIISAPFQTRQNVSYADEAKWYFDEYCFGVNGIGYLTGAWGKCVTFFDESITSYVRDNYTFDSDGGDTDDIMYAKITADLRSNVEFVFVMLMLKRINYTYTLQQKERHCSDAHKIQRSYNADVMFILSLQKGCYGSVREQLAFFEKTMKWFLDTKNVSEEMNAVDSIISEEESRRNTAFQNIISIGGLIITAVFGLPAVKETAQILRGFLTAFFPDDIPCVTTDGVSIAVWLLLLGCIIPLVISSQSDGRRNRDISE